MKLRDNLLPGYLPCLVLKHQKHYFGSVKETTKQQLRAIFVDEALSPAELETMASKPIALPGSLSPCST